MTKTSLEVCTEAANMIGVAADDEPLTADMLARFKLHLVDIFAMLQGNPHNLAFDWTIETVPDGVFLPLARMVGGSVAGSYGVPDQSGLYAVGLDGVRRFAARDMAFTAPVKATYY